MTGAVRITRPWETGDTARGAVATDLIVQQVAKAIASYPGKVPGDWKRWAEKTCLAKRIPWESLVRQAVSSVVAAGRRGGWGDTRPPGGQGQGGPPPLPRPGRRPVCVVVG